MRVFLDTSVLVAGMLKGHPRHTVALSWLQRIQQRIDVGLVAAHSLAELYACSYPDAATAAYFAGAGGATHKNQRSHHLRGSRPVRGRICDSA